MEFGCLAFEEIIRRAKDQGYRFLRFDQSLDGAEPSQRRIYLRHDVDISPRMALRLGEIAGKNGITSNLFFQINSETYTLCSPQTLKYIERLREMNHCVGLHVDENLIGSDEEAVARTIEWFRTCCGPIDSVVSFHRPNERVLGRVYQKFVNAYGAPFFGEDRYLSDSRRSLAFWPKLTEWLEEGRSPIQLLLHPEWWHSVSSTAEFADELRRRRVWELECYMATHFRRVFEGVVKPGADEFGI
ncbi:MAG TPA: hypothetical protein VGH38_05915 [Bryobacteraceae bacterium]|jgi:hypothetical protein